MYQDTLCRLYLFVYSLLIRFLFQSGCLIQSLEDVFSCSHQQKQFKEAVKVISSGSLLFASYLTVVGDERFYANQLMPLLQRIVGPETAHLLAVKIIGMGLVPLNRYQDPASLVSMAQSYVLSRLDTLN